MVLGNGPSLKQVNFSQLKNSNVTTLGTNRIAQVCKRESWLPDYYVSFFVEPLRGQNIFFSETGETLVYPGDIKTAESSKKDIEYMCYNEEVTCFVSQYYKTFINPEKTKNTFFIRPVKWNRHIDLPEYVFSKIKKGQFMHHSATSQLFQLAFWLEPRSIGIVGQDGFDKKLKINHFEGYDGNEQSLKKFDIANRRMKLLHEAVKHYVVQNNIKTYNISEKSVISEYHEKIDFSDFVEKI